jgi:hypothetical protein
MQDWDLGLAHLYVAHWCFVSGVGHSFRGQSDDAYITSFHGYTSGTAFLNDVALDIHLNATETSLLCV